MATIGRTRSSTTGKRTTRAAASRTPAKRSPRAGSKSKTGARKGKLRGS